MTSSAMRILAFDLRVGISDPHKCLDRQFRALIAHAQTLKALLSYCAAPCPSLTVAVLNKFFEVLKVILHTPRYNPD